MNPKFLLLTVGLSLVACVNPPAQSEKTGPSVEHGLSAAMTGIRHLLLSPLQIAAGLLEGVASVPYYLSMELHELNKGLVQAQAKVTLEDTYDAVYGKSLNNVVDNGEVGVTFSRMKQANQSFQKLLKEYGIPQSQHYILTSIEDSQNIHTLFAVIYRPVTQIQVLDKRDGRSPRMYSVEDRLFYEPFQYNTDQQVLDTIIDWAALPKQDLSTQKAQALLMTLAANAVIKEKRAHDYWQVERRWLSGQAAQIVGESASRVRDRMGLGS